MYVVERFDEGAAIRINVVVINALWRASILENSAASSGGRPASSDDRRRRAAWLRSCSRRWRTPSARRQAAGSRIPTRPATLCPRPSADSPPLISPRVPPRPSGTPSVGGGDSLVFAAGQPGRIAVEAMAAGHAKLGRPSRVRRLSSRRRGRRRNARSSIGSDARIASSGLRGKSRGLVRAIPPKGSGS
jgi:hypothetical protein